ncbi:MAG TPA: hypothetical protein PKY13_03210 [Microthrixaceae bacterium]|jgi:hypothetical protein|nr:hypothetical protein [Microthrixaceae bacterium]
MNHERLTSRAPTPTARRLRGPLVGLVASFALIGGACAPQTPPAGGGGIGIDFGPLTIPLPPITIRPPATTIPVGICNIGYQPPGVQIIGATVTIPGVRVDPNNPIITVPNVVVNIPQLRLPLSTVGLNCGLINLTTQVDLLLPSTVVVKAATLNIAARTITLTDPSFTVNGAGLGIPGLGDLVVPLPPIVAVPLPSGAIAF